jgi:flagellar protein FliS
MQQGYQVYRSANIDTADQGKLILITYDFAIKHCRLAMDKFGDYRLIADRTKHLFKAQDAITELLSALRLDVGEIARNLYSLYSYMLRTLTQAGIKGDRSKVEEVLGYLVTLRGAWEVAAKKVKCASAETCAANAVTTGWRR